MTDYIVNSDYCSCNEFEKAVDYIDIRYYRPKDDRLTQLKRQAGACILRVTNVRLLVWSLSNTVPGVLRN
jgi:hypothetical protein